ncbi:MAG: amino acid adenylation domain-containing protein [bacterium]|nr:amino acid adenylation domain-containing protein [bacterium]
MSETGITEVFDSKMDQEFGGPCSLSQKSQDKIVAEFPLSPGQKALWFLQRLAPESPAYHIFRAIEVATDLDVEIFYATFKLIVARHAALRTTFLTRDGEPMQQVHESMDFEFKVADATSWSESYLNQHLNQEALRPFDLEHGPLFRVIVLRRSIKNYVVLFNYHHIISDLWSLAILINEIGILYDALKSKNAPALAPIEIEYSDYIRNQAAMLAGSAGSELQKYWFEKLSGELPVLTLPFDRARPTEQTYLGSSKALYLGNDVVAALKSLAKTNRVSFFSALISAFFLLLSRYSGQTDIIVGTPKAGRQRSTLKTVGYFVNAIPLRASCAGTERVSDFLKQVHQNVMEASDHDALPFSLMVEQLMLERDPSRSPIFQVLFTMQKTTRLVDSDGVAFLSIGESGGCMNWGSIPIFTRGLERRIAPFDLTMLVAETNDDCIVSIQYNIDLFNDATIERMIAHYQTLLTNLVANPERQLSQVPILSDQERKQVLVDWNATAKIFPEQKCIHELFEELIPTVADFPAVVFEGQQLSYRELNERSNQFAHYLQKRGVTPDTIVGICLERSFEMIVSMLAVLKAGGAFLPLDSAYPCERLSFMLEDSHASIVITTQKSDLNCSQIKVPTICLDSEWDVIAQETRSNPVSGVNRDNLSYIIYTSGSTGKPKGTMLNHLGLCNLSVAQHQAFDIKIGTRILQFSSPSFDASVWEVVMALVNGATLYLATLENLAPGKSLMTTLRDNKINVVTLPPSVLAVLPVESLPDLQVLITAGEKCSKDLVSRWRAIPRIFNAYGPTETTVCASMFEVPDNNDESPPIGRPVQNFQLYILDENLAPVPIGVTGELCISGVGLARGYLNRPDLTANKFIPNPYSSIAGDRLYRTGDRARYLPDGNIDFLGRIDQQVKVRGFRIELGEIEAALSGHPDVFNAVVQAYDAKEGNAQLVAYIIAKAGRNLNIEDLRNFLKARLPNFMIPSLYLEMKEFPLTPSGKVNRKALPPPDRSKINRERTVVQPDTNLEKIIAELWQEVLNVEKISVHDNFFELGGHSLLASKVHTLLSERVRPDFSISDIFKYPTIHSLSEYLAGKENQKEMFVAKQQRVLRQKEALQAQRQRMKNSKIMK